MEKGLTEHTAILRKGALVAQNPDGAYDITGDEALDEDEKAILRKEVEHKWSMPARLYLTIAMCSVGAAVQGWDQTGSNGATIFFPQEYGIGDPNSTRDTLLVGLVNAGPYIGSAFLGCWLSDPFNNLWGRRGKYWIRMVSAFLMLMLDSSAGAIFVSAHFCIWPVIGSAFCQTWGQQLACRLLMGIGMGLKASTG